MGRDARIHRLPVTLISLTICQIALSIRRTCGPFCQQCLLFIGSVLADCQARLALEIIGNSSATAMSGLRIDMLAAASTHN
jgi:hypothetical protein